MLNRDMIEYAKQIWLVSGILQRTPGVDLWFFIDEKGQNPQKNHQKTDESASTYFSPTQQFWEIMCNNLKQWFQYSMHHSPFLSLSYPYLLKILAVFINHLSSTPAIAKSLDTDGTDIGKRHQLLNSVSQV